jgi:hypothetical protein
MGEDANTFQGCYQKRLLCGLWVKLDQALLNTFLLNEENETLTMLPIRTYGNHCQTYRCEWSLVLELNSDRAIALRKKGIYSVTFIQKCSNGVSTMNFCPFNRSRCRGALGKLGVGLSVVVLVAPIAIATSSHREAPFIASQAGSMERISTCFRLRRANLINSRHHFGGITSRSRIQGGLNFPFQSQ